MVRPWRGCALVTEIPWCPRNRRSGTPFSPSKVKLRYRSSMPAAAVPSLESSKLEHGQSTKAVGGVRPRNLSHRIANTALSLTLLGGFTILGGCSATPFAASNASTKSSICARHPSRLTPVSTSTVSTLPPSHDNDVGGRRLPGLHPDADVDANQISVAGRCQKS